MNESSRFEDDYEEFRERDPAVLRQWWEEFEAAARRPRHGDPNREVVASILIDTIGGRRGQGIPAAVREGAML
jgi:hypothetical protein